MVGTATLHLKSKVVNYPIAISIVHTLIIFTIAIAINFRILDN